MPFGYLFPGKAWRPGSAKYGKVRMFSLAPLTPLTGFRAFKIIQFPISFALSSSSNIQLSQYIIETIRITWSDQWPDFLTCQHAAPQFLDNWQSISPSHHWTEAQGTDLPSLRTFDTPPQPPLWTIMISVWVPPDDWTSCLSPEEVSLPLPGTVSTCQDLTAILSVLTFPTPSCPLVDIWYIPGHNWTLPLTLQPSPSIVMYLITWGKQLFAKMCKENVKYTTFMMWEHLASFSDFIFILGLNLW